MKKDIGFGTYRLQGDVCARAVDVAYDVGYRMFDTATYYENFRGMAKGIKGKDRSELYLISKVWHDKHRRADLFQDLEMTLKEMETDYLDAYFLHWPNSQAPIEETLGAMQELQVQGKIRHIGLSNFTVNHLKRVFETGVPVDWVQVEMHPFFYDKLLLEMCKAKGIGVQGWRPLNLGKTGIDPLLSEIGVRYGKTPSQVALRWIIQMGCVPLPGSQNPQHIKENFDVFDFTLSGDEMQRLSERAASGARFRLGPEHGLGFSDEFDFSFEECYAKT